MEKQMKPNRRDMLVVLLLVISICISLAGCTVTQDVFDPTSESITIEIPNTTSENQIPAETNSATVPDNSESTPARTETAPTETAHVHNYSSKVSVATCTETGYTTYTCSACGNSYTGNKTNSTGHSWGSWTVTKEPTTTAKGQEQRICKTCDKAESRSVEKLAYESFTGSIGNYNAHNLAYIDWKGDEEQAAFIEVYTIGKSDKTLSDLAAQFEKVYGFAPSLGDKYRCTTSCNKLGTYMVEGYSEPQTVYYYTITDKTYIYITNEMYKVYVQQCADGSVWVGYCIYGTMDTLGTERNKANVKALDKEMYATFEELIGLSRSEMNAYKEQLELKIGYVSEAGTVRSAHSDAPVQVLYIYCRGFAYGDNNS